MVNHNLIAENFFQKTYLLQALDPIHVGSGGYRLGRVDNTIIRDYDNVPKIPGSSLEGTARAYLAMQINIGRQCAGKSKCGANNRTSCPVCAVFGFSDGEESRKGTASFYDARILLFPVKTMVGVVWITTVERLNEYIKEPSAQIELTPSNEEVISAVEKGLGKHINLGWILLSIDYNHATNAKLINILKTLPTAINKNIVIVNEKIFSQVVNDNLEVRTSVSIDPATGAASNSALFTFEAIPRTTVLWFDVVYFNPKNFNIEIDKIKTELYETSEVDPVEIIKEFVEKGMKYYPSLGLGGMSTRGFGRARVLNQVSAEINGGESNGKQA